MESINFAADTLMTELHSSGGKVWGRSKKELPVGPCVMGTYLEAFSNAMGQKDSSFFVQVTGNLWFYLLAGKSSALYIVDGGKAGLTEMNAPVYGGSTQVQTLKELAELGSVTAVFKYAESLGWFPAVLKKELPIA